MEIRELRDDERELAYALSSLAFMQGQRETPWAKDPNQPKATAIGVWDERGYRAQVVVLNFQSHMGPDAVMPMGGIAGVACNPAARGKGYARAALRRSLEHMRDNGMVLSMLFPFSWQFYQTVGWDWVGNTRRYRVATRVLQATEGTERCRQAVPEDRPSIAEVYRRFAGRYRGMTNRSDKHWNAILDDKPDTYTYTYVYEGDAGIEGYLTYSGGSHESTDLREFICLTACAERGLLGLLGRLDMQTRAVVWSAPADDLLWSLIVDHENETRLWVTTQARVVDVQAAISAWKPADSARGSVVVGITDASADWNTGAWHVEFAEGIATATRTDAEPQVAMDIRAFSQAFFGTPEIGAIRRADRMTVSDERGYDALRACLAGPPMWINDSF